MAKQTKKIDTYSVKIAVPALNIRKGAGMNHAIVSVITDKGPYTIVEESKGWGKLESGDGWICLKFCEKA